jgi:hypothetical protein
MASERDVIRRQFERCAELSRRGPTDTYAARWSTIHQVLAEAAVKRALART